jgi:hypothetical protein
MLWPLVCLLFEIRSEPSLLKPGISVRSQRGGCDRFRPSRSRAAGLVGSQVPLELSLAEVWLPGQG